MTNANPMGGNNVIASLVIEGAAEAIDLYKKAFGAKEDYRMETPDGKIMHASITIDGTRIFLAEYNPDMGCGSPTVSGFYAYVTDVDAVHKQATQAGLSELFPITDMFWGDRTGSVKDKFGITWTLATHVRDVTPEEMEKGRLEFMKKAA